MPHNPGLNDITTVGVNKRRTDWADESRTLAVLRDALLSKLLSGELRVPAAGTLLEVHA